MRILVTGGSGFLGSHVADALTRAGHEVVLYDVMQSHYACAGQTMVVGDVLDFTQLERAMSGCDVVYHLAAIADLDEAIQKPLDTVRINIMGTAQVLDLAQFLKIKRLVYASTIYVYSDHGSFYRTSKRASELLIEDYRKQYGLQYTILRFGSLYGPRADDHNSVHRMLAQALLERHIEYSGTGEEVREYIHVHDAAESAVRILSTEFVNQNVSITGHERMKTREMVDMINEILGGDVKIVFTKRPDSGHYVQTPYNYTPKLGKKLSRESYIDLGLGLLDCLHELDRERRELV